MSNQFNFFQTVYYTLDPNEAGVIIAVVQHPHNQTTYRVQWADYSITELREELIMTEEEAETERVIRNN
jgi:hypothetical protein